MIKSIEENADAWLKDQKQEPADIKKCVRSIKSQNDVWYVTLKDKELAQALWFFLLNKKAPWPGAGENDKIKCAIKPEHLVRAFTSHEQAMPQFSQFSQQPQVFTPGLLNQNFVPAPQNLQMSNMNNADLMWSIQ